MSHRIVSYNILSSHLANPEHFASCDPVHLDANNRLEQILAKLTPYIQQQSIICLQEVSITWAGPLHAFFAAHGYYFTTAQYGGAFNNYMGVGIAWPLARYQALDIDITRLSDTRKWQRKPKFEHYKMTCLNFLARKLRIRKLKIDDPLAMAKRRFNQVVFVRFKDTRDDSVFCVANYHMPCAFYAPKVMTLHVAMYVQWVQKLSQNAPYILTGDFNIKPHSPQYQLITTGALDTSAKAYPDTNKEDAWTPEISQPLRSAYATYQGKEPKFTNYAQVRNNPVFIETLDYIWLSKAWQVNSVLPLPGLKEVDGPFPNEIEPSDHIAIAADLTLQHNK